MIPLCRFYKSMDWLEMTRLLLVPTYFLSRTFVLSLVFRRDVLKKEQKALEAEQKKKITHSKHEFRQEKEITLEKHFQDNIDLLSRNSAIIRALKDGYGQAEIARYLDVSAALISHVFRSSNANKKSAPKGICGH